MKQLTYIFIFFNLCLSAQQTTQFTQFTFNKYGYNPAAAGTNINAGLEAITGIRKQWVGFGNAPASNFFSATYTVKPQRSYRLWHNAGVYVINDKAGIFQNMGVYGSYALHLPLTNKWNMSFGIMAGLRRFSLVRSAISPDDPVHAASSDAVLAYPDLIPGIRLYTKKFFFDASIQQITKSRQAQGGKRIGTPSALPPHTYLSVGKKIALDHNFILVPAVNVHGSFTALPSVEANVIAYYRARVGIGATLRNTDFVSGILQVRFFKNVTAGFAYDFSINKFTSAYSNTLEFMLGITPMMTSLEDRQGKRHVAQCPDFDF
jgi:type IX secretion system PorP/SprF family membrane protein